jgi:hypothetical protein
MGLESTIAWKASPTCTPPPICTLAPVSKTALVSRSWALRTTKGIHDAQRLAMHLIHHWRNQFFICVNGARGIVHRLETKFLNRRAESRTSAALSYFADGNK